MSKPIDPASRPATSGVTEPTLGAPVDAVPSLARLEEQLYRMLTARIRPSTRSRRLD